MAVPHQLESRSLEVPRSVEVDGGRLAYGVLGDGPAVLFIQGVGVHGAGWRPQVDDFGADHRCVWFDHRGIGASQPRPRSVSVAQMAGDALAVLDAAGVERAHVVGHSLGGLVAQQLAIAAPARVRSLALLCTMARGKDAATSPRMLWLGLRSRLGTAAMRRRAFLQIVLPAAALANADLERLAAELAPLFGHDLASHPAVEMAQLKALRAADLSAQLHAVVVPTLVVAAAHDLIAPPRLGRRLAAAIPGARYVELADAAHGAPIGSATAVNGHLRRHFAGARAAP
jgi:pimeloyl-ACP methyl ester carboxylesterase